MSFSTSFRNFQKKIIRSDFFFILLGSYIASAIRFGSFSPNLFKNNEYKLFILIIFLNWMLAFKVLDVWSNYYLRTLSNSIRSILYSSALATVVSGFIAFLLHDNISRLWLLETSLLTSLLLLLSRIFFYNLILIKLKSSTNKRILVIKNEWTSVFIQDLVDLIDIKKENPIFIEFPVPKDRDLDEWFRELYETIERENVDYILIYSGSIKDPLVFSKLNSLYKFNVTSILFSSNLASMFGSFHRLPGSNWVMIEEPSIVNSDAVLKRIFDILFSVISIILLFPILIFISLAVKVSSKGPVFYIDKRIGQNGRLFSFPKFRSMYVGSDSQRSEVIGEPDEFIALRYKADSRITPLGRFIRRWSLDELPQFFCVLIGSMSIVGPRPILQEEVDLVEPEDSIRFVAKPGLTGLWQVSGRKDVPWEDRIKMEVDYVQNWSLFDDLSLCFRTFVALVKGKGAY